MPYNRARQALIAGVSAYVPEEILDNKRLEQMVNTSDDWIMQRTGIKERRLLPHNKPTSYIGEQSVAQLLKKTNTQPEEIDLIICGTNTPDMLFPPTATQVAYETGCHKAAAFDIQAACPSFSYSLFVGAQFIETGCYPKIIVLGIDKMSSIVDYKDRRNCVLFGDGGGAVLLKATTEPNIGILDSKMRANGSGLPHLCMKAGGSLHPATEDTVRKGQHFIHQDGGLVFKEAVKCMSDVCLELIKRNNLKINDIDWIIPHQANLRIIQSIIKVTNIDPKKVLVNIERYGNTSAGTIPICLWEFEKKFKKGDKIILVSFGAGYLWSGLYLIWGYDS